MSNEVASLNHRKSLSKLKWLFFLFWTLFSFGSNYAFDNPSALKDLLFEDNHHSLSRKKYEVLFSGFYAFYSIPNIIFPLLNGLFIDKIGVKTMLIFLSILTILGQFLVFHGCGTHNFAYMFTGRLIFGYGSESLTAAQNVYITHYFHNEKLAFPISIGNAVALFGTYLNYSLTAEIARKYGLKFGFLSGMFFCMISLLAIILTITIDFFIEKSLKNPQEIATSSDEVEILIKPEILLNSEEKSVFSRFSASFWILLFSSVIVYASSIGFSSIAVSYFVESYFPKVDLKTAEIESTRIMSLDSLTNIFSSIFLAIFMHYTSSNFLYIFPTINSIISLIAFTMLLLTIFPFLTLILDGLASSLNYNILNTMIPRMVKEKDLGLAYCMAAAGNNLGTSLIPIIAAFLRNARDNYDMAIGLFILLNVGSLISAMMFYFQYKEKLLKEKEEANY